MAGAQSGPHRRQEWHGYCASSDRRGLSRAGGAGDVPHLENGFCVLRLKVRGQRDLVTVVGHAATIAAGEFVQAERHLDQ